MNVEIPENLFSHGQDYCKKICEQDKSISIDVDDGGNLSSIKPVESLFGYTYHSHLIPPFKPETICILGYGRGTVAELIRKVWGPDIKITGVDLKEHSYDYMEYKMVIGDAEEFVHECTNSLLKTRFDYVVVDLFNPDVPEFVFDEKFAYRLKKMTKQLLSINVPLEDFKRLKAYDTNGFKFHRFVQIFGNNVSWWGL